MRACLQRFRTLVVVGCGEVVRDRLRRAVQHLRRTSRLRVVYLDLFEQPPFALADDEHYLRALPGSRLPVEALRRLGALGPQTLAVVCTPTAWHLHYAEQLLPLVGRVAVEKPLTRHHDAAAPLLAGGPSLQPISHFLFKQAMRRWRQRCRRKGLPWLRYCGGIRVDIIESKGIGPRQIDPVVFDLGWHGLEVLLAPFRAAGCTPYLEFRSVCVGTYEPPPGEVPPAGATAARLTGRVRVAGFHLPFDIRLGKGLGIDRKALVYEMDGPPSRHIDLSESGWKSHARLLAELLTADQPDLGIDLGDAVELVRLCALGESRARDEGRHPFGQMPAFLHDDRANPALMGLYY
jgi:hypothetical protein